MIAAVDSAALGRLATWAFWGGCAMAAIAAFVPVLLAGTSGRMSVATVPFIVGALAMGACALLHHRGRAFAVGLYVVAGLAIVYGVLAMFAVMLQISVMSACPPAPAACGLGYARPLTSGESTGRDVAIALGMLSLMAGFAGLLAVYRRERSKWAPPIHKVAPLSRPQTDSTAGNGPEAREG
jgi:hypothetical protein